MQTHGLITKRWVLFFILFFIVWYPISLVLVTAYQVLAQPFLVIAMTVFTPLWALLASYLYFRKARSDWTARTVTAFGWIILMLICAALLVKPVYGYDWTSVINWNVINAQLMTIVAIIVGGMAAHKTIPSSNPLPPQPKQ